VQCCTVGATRHLSEIPLYLAQQIFRLFLSYCVQSGNSAVGLNSYWLIAMSSNTVRAIEFNPMTICLEVQTPSRQLNCNLLLDYKLTLHKYNSGWKSWQYEFYAVFVITRFVDFINVTGKDGTGHSKTDCCFAGLLIGKVSH
jgi:hypothetical protein